MAETPQARREEPARAGFFYSILDDGQARKAGYCPRVMIVAPSYGATLKDVKELVAFLRVKVKEAGLPFTDNGDEAVHIYKGIEGPGYRKLHVVLEISFDVPAQEARSTLGSAGFTNKWPNSRLY